MTPYSARDVEDEQAAINRTWAEITPEMLRCTIAKIRLHPNLKAQAAFGVMLAGALSRHAPQHLGLLPPEWVPVVAP